MKKIRKIFFRLTVVPFVLAVLFAGGASGYDQADLLKLKTMRVCPSCDLSDANLSNARLSGADLHDANLTMAVLKGANLSGATWDGWFEMQREVCRQMQ